MKTRIIFVAIIGLTAVVLAGIFVVNGRREPVVGLVGSEKVPFFSDPRVIDALRGHGLDVTVQRAGSREIATSFELSEYDFVFPAGVPAAEKIQREQGIGGAHRVFFTPMVVATWEPIAALLVAQGIATQQAGYYTLDMEPFLSWMQAERRWSDLPGNIAFDVNRAILLTSTDVRTSNSAAMYLALASYVANGDNIVQSLPEAEAVLPLMASLFLRQGFRPDSSQEPFEDYLVKGMGHSPMVMIYEAQFIGQATVNQAALLPEMVLMYPSPTIFTEHILIPLSENGDRLGNLLATDPELQKLAIEYGFRNGNLSYFRDYTAQVNIALPEQIVDVIDPPTYEVLEGMIQRIEELYQQ